MKKREKILLSTYIIRIEDERNSQNISLFRNSDNLLSFFSSFLNALSETIYWSQDADNVKHLTIESSPTVNKTNGFIYGFLSSGISGDRYKIKDLLTRDEVLSVERKHAAFRSMFFYLSVPPGSETGALILQRRGRFGIKEILTEAIDGYLSRHVSNRCHVRINNILHGQVFQRMMDDGRLRTVHFIKHTIPPTLEELFNNGNQADQVQGMLKTTLHATTKKGLPQAFKDTISKWWLKNSYSEQQNNERIELEGLRDNYDEIEFELDVKGKKKKFYMYERDRILPDIDVTGQLDYEANNNEPTKESFVRVARELIQDLIELKSPYADEN